MHSQLIIRAKTTQHGMIQVHLLLHYYDHIYLRDVPEPHVTFNTL